MEVKDIVQITKPKISQEAIKNISYNKDYLNIFKVLILELSCTIT